MKFVLLLVLLVFAGIACSIPQDGLKIGVPYRAQETSFYCTPACVQMWRAYDGLAPVLSQRQIFEAMGGTVGCGAEASQVEQAVRGLTLARDAYLDEVSGATNDDYFARQITSIDSRTPVLALANQHAVILNGGKWHFDPATGLNVWDYVYVHDPALEANHYSPSNRWLLESCEFFGCRQIVSAGAVRGWDAYLLQWGTDLVVPGRPRPGPPPL